MSGAFLFGEDGFCRYPVTYAVELAVYELAARERAVLEYAETADTDAVLAAYDRTRPGNLIGFYHVDRRGGGRPGLYPIDVRRG